MNKIVIIMKKELLLFILKRASYPKVVKVLKIEDDATILPQDGKRNKKGGKG